MARKAARTAPEPPPGPLRLLTGRRYDKDVGLAQRRKMDMDRLIAVIESLRNRQPLAARHRDHALTGDWIGFRECHVAPDWLLIYHVEGDRLFLDRLGSHADLFG